MKTKQKCKSKEKCKYTTDKIRKLYIKKCKERTGDIENVCITKTKINPISKFVWDVVYSECKENYHKKNPKYNPVSSFSICKDVNNKNGKFIKRTCKYKYDKSNKTCNTLYKRVPKLYKYNSLKTCIGTKIKQTKGKQSKRRQSKRKQSKRRQSKRKTLRGGTVNPIAEIGSMFGTLGSSLQSVVSSLTIPPATAFNPSLPISADPSKQFINNNLTQPISTIYK
jgi:hypothetical protein